MRTGVLDVHTRPSRRDPEPAATSDSTSAFGVAPASTTVTRRSTPSFAHSASSASEPRNNLLMRLRQLATHDDLAVGAQRLDGVLERLGQPPRRLEEHAVRDSKARVPSQVIRAECLRGAKPSKQNLSDGSPDTASAVVTADGPGKHEIVTRRRAGSYEPIARGR